MSFEFVPTLLILWLFLLFQSEFIKPLFKRKEEKRLLIVIPFVKNEVNEIYANLNSWNSFCPCTAASVKTNYVTDLFFYFHRSLDDNMEFIFSMKSKVQGVKKGSCWDVCVDNVGFIFADLNEKNDKYPLGASKMFFKLFSMEFMKDYDYLYLMESDNRPCRENWLTKMHEFLHPIQPFWMLGSIVRGASEEMGGFNFADHMNGNALYNIKDEAFLSFLKIVEGEFDRDPSRYLESYDIAVYKVLMDRTVFSFRQYADLKDKFVYTSFIQNYYRNPINGTELCKRNENTFLIHGRNVYW